MKEQKDIAKLFGKLTNQEERVFPLKGSQLQASKNAGVYVIEDDEKRVVHVGTSKCLEKRLQNHLHGKSSFVRNYKPLMKKGVNLRGKYTFKYIEVEKRMRGLLECYAIGSLCPKHHAISHKDE